MLACHISPDFINWVRGKINEQYPKAPFRINNSRNYRRSSIQLHLPIKPRVIFASAIRYSVNHQFSKHIFNPVNLINAIINPYAGRFLNSNPNRYASANRDALTRLHNWRWSLIPLSTAEFNDNQLCTGQIARASELPVNRQWRRNFSASSKNR
jgi:hypothetical protein